MYNYNLLVIFAQAAKDNSMVAVLYRNHELRTELLFENSLEKVAWLFLFLIRKLKGSHPF